MYIFLVIIQAIVELNKNLILKVAGAFDFIMVAGVAFFCFMVMIIVHFRPEGIKLCVFLQLPASLRARFL